mgnify:CR=1 FL=1
MVSTTFIFYTYYIVIASFYYALVIDKQKQKHNLTLSHCPIGSKMFSVNISFFLSVAKKDIKKRRERRKKERERVRLPVCFMRLEAIGVESNFKPGNLR